MADLPPLVEGPRFRHDPAFDAEPRLVVLMPHLSVERMTGGPNTVLQITERMAARGTQVRYVACFGPLQADVEGLRRHLRDVSGVAGSETTEFVDGSAPGAVLSAGRGDVMLATWWPTAHVAERSLAVTGADAFVYLIQDFEPGFHPWSTKYALAAATYRMSFRAIMNQPSLLEHLRAHGGLRFDAHDSTRAISFMPAVDRIAFQPRERPAGSRRLAFYARPKHSRNLFDLGLRAIGQAAEQGAFAHGPWTFGAIGGETRRWRLPGGGLLEPQPRLPYRDYAAYLAESDVLVSLMLSPHTSYPPLEMATAGGLVVTNTFGAKTADALAAISPAIRGVPPDVVSLASAILQAARDVAGGHPTAQATTLPGSWDESLADVVPWLEATILAARDRSPS